MMTIVRRETVLADAPQKLDIRCSLTDVFVRDVQCACVLLYAGELDAPRLARALARVLSAFAPFAARLRRRAGERFIECGGAGATFTIARSERTLAATIDRLDDRDRSELVDTWDGRRAWSSDQPVLSCRVTHFVGGGSALGISWHHAIGDFQSVIS
ncbi:MAG TPA: acyltransferase, partial [Polyangiales bacterium]